MPSFQGQSLTLQENEFDLAQRLVRRQNPMAIMASVGLRVLYPAQSEHRLRRESTDSRVKRASLGLRLAYGEPKIRVRRTAYNMRLIVLYRFAAGTTKVFATINVSFERILLRL